MVSGEFVNKKVCILSIYVYIFKHYYKKKVGKMMQLQLFL